MSYITWNTKAGSLGSIAQSQYYEIPLSAVDSNSMPLQFTHIAGTMPLGMRIDSSTGVVKGVPVIQSTGASKTQVNLFTIRASNADGVVADRSFTITVNNFSSVKINASSGVLGVYDDGKLLEYQFTATSDNPNPQLTWKIINGELPIDAVTGKQIVLSQSGLLKGYISKLINTDGVAPGFDETNNDTYPYDFPTVGQDRSYTFTVLVTDGANFDTAEIRINVVAKGHLTADNTITYINNTFLTVDTDASYPPIIITDPTAIPQLTVGDNFTFKFEAINLNEDTPHFTYGPIEWGYTAEAAAGGMTVSKVSGWMSGTIPPQIDEQSKYTFAVFATQTQTNLDTGSVVTLKSLELPVTITAVKDSSNYISWTTPSNLGTMVNGSISEYKIEAVNNAGRILTYTLDSGTLPSNFKLMSNGEIVGRNGFEYFSIDNHFANITVDSITGITTGMTVEGPGIASGCHVTAIHGANTVTIRPSTYVTEGSEVTFVDLINNVSVTKQLTSLSSTTMIDGGKTTFDNSYSFTVRATTTDNSVSATCTFAITKDNYNRAPYENVWLRALLLKEQRDLYYSIISNTDIFPTELIYRADDPNFGLADTLKMLFVPGLTVTDLSNYALAIEKNHYTKTIKFGNIKTARALDDNFNVQYEVVYIEVNDDKESKGKSAALSQTPQVTVPYIYDNQNYTTLYPNSYENMKYRLGAGVGYANRGALPRWMTSRQEDGKELGLVRAIVLAYTIPGASKLIAYRLKDSGIAFNDLHFVSDRYYLGASAAANYDPALNDFFANPTDITDKYIHYTQYGVYR